MPTGCYGMVSYSIVYLLMSVMSNISWVLKAVLMAQ